MRLPVVSSLLLALVLGALPVRAQARDNSGMMYPTAPPPLTLDFYGTEPNLRYRVHTREGRKTHEAPLAGCEGDCRLMLYPGRYMLRVEHDAEVVSHGFELERSTLMRVTPEDPTKRGFGIALAALGPVILVSTLLFHLSTMDSFGDRREGEERSRPSSGESLLIGAGYLTGLGVTGAGWALWASGRMRVEPQPLGPR